MFLIMLSGLVDVEALAMTLHLCSLGGLARKGCASVGLRTTATGAFRSTKLKSYLISSAFARIPNFPFVHALVSRSMVALASAALCGHLSVLSNKHPETCSETLSP